MSYNKSESVARKKPTRIISEEQINRFGERLRMAMNGMSNNAFAKQCGWSEKVIRNYLNGDTYPSLDRLAVIANVSGCSIGWLASGENDETSDFMTNEEPEVTKSSHATPEQQQLWKEILDRMTPTEREAVLDKVFRQGINTLLSTTQTGKPTSGGQFPWSEDAPEKLGVSNHALVVAHMYESLSIEERKSFLESLEEEAQEPASHHVSSKNKAS
ncbi:helix-turn-helix domain-containing protein [Xenorhabdus miraniensis]|uniref:Transcriptional regulator n=1 Tax=Xenorhabdus miraniensis TaxID=351674 RepID=A0A2D0JSU6_9GAMM|nr:helix-turn-helix domain-containing protein [Xenorhabdus miraniensis]PHM49380.1 transcriptional regulator [Xenorhabdus miraniensis]